jgi:hypothetical protein
MINKQEIKLKITIKIIKIKTAIAISPEEEVIVQEEIEITEIIIITNIREIKRLTRVIYQIIGIIMMTVIRIIPQIKREKVNI